MLSVGLMLLPLKLSGSFEKPTSAVWLLKPTWLIMHKCAGTLGTAS